MTDYIEDRVSKLEGKVSNLTAGHEMLRNQINQKADRYPAPGGMSQFDPRYDDPMHTYPEAIAEVELRRRYGQRAPNSRYEAIRRELGLRSELDYTKREIDHLRTRFLYPPSIVVDPFKTQTITIEKPIPGSILPWKRGAVYNKGDLVVYEKRVFKRLTAPVGGGATVPPLPSNHAAYKVGKGLPFLPSTYADWVELEVPTPVVDKPKRKR